MEIALPMILRQFFLPIIIRKNRVTAAAFFQSGFPLRTQIPLSLLRVSLLILILFLAVSCQSFDPSLYVVETIRYPLQPEVEIPPEVQSIAVASVGPNTGMSTGNLYKALLKQGTLSERFEVLDPDSNPSESGAQDATVRIYNSEPRTKEVIGTDRYDSNFLVSLYEFFSFNKLTDFDFSLVVEKHYPVEDYYDIYGYHIEQGDVLHEEEGYVSRIIETGADTLIISFDADIGIYPADGGEALYKINSGYYHEFLRYEPDEYDISVEPGGNGSVVTEFPNPDDIVEDVLLNLAEVFSRQLSPQINQYKVEIHPIVGYEDWPNIYELMKLGEYEEALEKLLSDISSVQDRYTEASFEYVIGSVYHILGDLDTALEYLNKAQTNSGFGFGHWVTDQFEQIEKRKALHPEVLH